MWRSTELTGWGRVTRAKTQLARPERRREAQQALSALTAGDSLIAHGCGRSYGDSALNAGGHGLLTTRLDRFISFDPNTGILEAEAGVTLKTVLDLFLHRGYIPPVMPGTSFVTLGGALANDVHGKNQHLDGSFGDHVTAFELLLPSGRQRRVTEETEPQLFRATIGGIGLTGLILSVAFRMKAVKSNGVQVTERRVQGLESFLEALKPDGEAGRASYSVGWIDTLARGRQLGRGILETAELSDSGVKPKKAFGLTVPFDFPGFALNDMTVSAFNTLYWRRVPATSRNRLRDLQHFLFPLDSLSNWNRIYGKRGFRQFQCLVPFEEGEKTLAGLLEEVSAARASSFLSVIKSMGQEGKGYLSFAGPGFTLAMDLPNKPGLEDLMQNLERRILDAGGRLYLAKDSCMSREAFEAMYPEVESFRQLRSMLDPEGKLASDMARRLGLMPGAGKEGGAAA